jgi:nicotinamidase-related amidase
VLNPQLWSPGTGVQGYQWLIIDSMSISPRSPELMSRSDTALLVVDMQDKLLRLMAGHERTIWNTRRLIDGAKLLGLPIAATEQYPQGLGPTAPYLSQRLGPLPAKTMFSCRECQSLLDGFRDRGIGKILVAGIEAHVCVQQTVLDLLADGYRVYLAVDAIGARHEIDYTTALRRMESSGATLTTTEAALFEWCETASAAEFKQISALIRESLPAVGSAL